MTTARQGGVELTVELNGELVDLQALVIEAGFTGVGNGNVQGNGNGL